LKAYFGYTPLDQIKNKNVEEFKAFRKGQLSTRLRRNETVRRKLRPASVNRELALLKHLFNHNEELIPKNPIRKVKMLDEQNIQDRVLTREEEKLYLLASSQPLRDISTLMLQTGMRPEEVCRIRRENVHLDQDYLLNPYGKTPAAKRRIPLTQTAKEILGRRLQQDGVYLFKGRIESKPIVNVNAAHTAAVGRSGVQHFTLYALRHNYATRAAMAGVDAITLAALLGHSKITLVMRYVHPSEQNKMAAMQRIEAAS
jgi:integrase